MTETRRDLIEEYLAAQSMRQTDNKSKTIGSFARGYSKVLQDTENCESIREYQLNHLLVGYGLNLENNRLKSEYIFKLITQLYALEYHEWIKFFTVLDSDNSSIANYKAELFQRIKTFK